MAAFARLFLTFNTFYPYMKKAFSLLAVIGIGLALSSCGGGGGGGGHKAAATSETSQNDQSESGQNSNSDSDKNSNSDSKSDSKSDKNTSEPEYAPYNMIGTLKNPNTGEFYNLYVNSTINGCVGKDWSYRGLLIYTRTGPNTGTLKGTMTMEAGGAFAAERKIDATLDFVSAKECLMSGTFNDRMFNGRTISGSLGGRWTMNLR